MIMVTIFGEKAKALGKNFNTHRPYTYVRTHMYIIIRKFKDTKSHRLNSLHELIAYASWIIHLLEITGCKIEVRRQGMDVTSIVASVLSLTNLEVLLHTYESSRECSRF